MPNPFERLPSAGSNQPAETENTVISFVENLRDSFTYSLYESPRNAIAQTANHIAGREVMTITQAPRQARPYSSDWYAQQIGGGVGTALPFVAAGALGRIGTRTLMGEAATGHLSRQMLLGAAYGGLATPVDDRPGRNFLHEKLVGAGVGALSFGLMEGVGVGARALAGSRVPILSPLLRCETLNHVGSGLAIGALTADVESYLHTGQGATGAQRWQSAVSFALMNTAMFGGRAMIGSGRSAPAERPAPPAETATSLTRPGAEGMRTVRQVSDLIDPTRTPTEAAGAQGEVGQGQALSARVAELRTLPGGETVRAATVLPEVGTSLPAEPAGQPRGVGEPVVVTAGVEAGGQPIRINSGLAEIRQPVMASADGGGNQPGRVGVGDSGRVGPGSGGGEIGTGPVRTGEGQIPAAPEGPRPEPVRVPPADAPPAVPPPEAQPRTASPPPDQPFLVRGAEPLPPELADPARLAELIGEANRAWGPQRDMVSWPQFTADFINRRVGGRLDRARLVDALSEAREAHLLSAGDVGPERILTERLRPEVWYADYLVDAQNGGEVSRLRQSIAETSGRQRQLRQAADGVQQQLNEAHRGVWTGTADSLPVAPVEPARLAEQQPFRVEAERPIPPELNDPARLSQMLREATAQWSADGARYPWPEYCADYIRTRTGNQVELGRLAGSLRTAKDAHMQFLADIGPDAFLREGRSAYDWYARYLVDAQNGGPVTRLRIQMNELSSGMSTLSQQVAGWNTTLAQQQLPFWHARPQ